MRKIEAALNLLNEWIDDYYNEICDHGDDCVCDAESYDLKVLREARAELDALEEATKDEVQNI